MLNRKKCRSDFTLRYVNQTYIKETKRDSSVIIPCLKGQLLLFFRLLCKCTWVLTASTFGFVVVCFFSRNPDFSLFLESGKNLTSEAGFLVGAVWTLGQDWWLWICILVKASLRILAWDILPKIYCFYPGFCSLFQLSLLETFVTFSHLGLR